MRFTERNWRPSLRHARWRTAKPAYQVDRLVVTREMIASSVQKRVNMGKRLTVNIDWRAEMDREFKNARTERFS